MKSTLTNLMFGVSTLVLAACARVPNAAPPGVANEMPAVEERQEGTPDEPLDPSIVLCVSPRY
jgi:hypothetical protein